jgi:hypothetical protein
MSMRLIFAFVATLSIAAAAHAQEVIIEGDAPVVDQVPADDAVALSDAPGPRVYGWAMRPADCGTFRYWNGERCADARDEPPVGE